MVELSQAPNKVYGGKAKHWKNLSQMIWFSDGLICLWCGANTQILFFRSFFLSLCFFWHSIRSKSQRTFCFSTLHRYPVCQRIWTVWRVNNPGTLAICYTIPLISVKHFYVIFFVYIILLLFCVKETKRTARSITIDCITLGCQTTCNFSRINAKETVWGKGGAKKEKKNFDNCQSSSNCKQTWTSCI